MKQKGTSDLYKSYGFCLCTVLISSVIIFSNPCYAQTSQTQTNPISPSEFTSGNKVRASTISTMRLQVNAKRAAIRTPAYPAGMPAFNFSDPNITPGTVIRARHFAELGLAIRQIYDISSGSNPNIWQQYFQSKYANTLAQIVPSGNQPTISDSQLRQVIGTPIRSPVALDLYNAYNQIGYCNDGICQNFSGEGPENCTTCPEDCLNPTLAALGCTAPVVDTICGGVCGSTTCASGQKCQTQTCPLTVNPAAPAAACNVIYTCVADAACNAPTCTQSFQNNGCTLDMGGTSGTLNGTCSGAGCSGNVSGTCTSTGWSLSGSCVSAPATCPVTGVFGFNCNCTVQLPQTNVGSSATGTCPSGYSNYNGSPSGSCTSSGWSGLQNPCAPGCQYIAVTMGNNATCSANPSYGISPGPVGTVQNIPGCSPACSVSCTASGLWVANPPGCVTVPPTCVDGTQNGDETGIDCGGTACPACGAGGSCPLQNLGGNGKCAKSLPASPLGTTINVSCDGTCTGENASYFCAQSPFDNSIYWSQQSGFGGCYAQCPAQPLQASQNRPPGDSSCDVSLPATNSGTVVYPYPPTVFGQGCPAGCDGNNTGNISTSGYVSASCTNGQWQNLNNSCFKASWSTGSTCSGSFQDSNGCTITMTATTGNSITGNCSGSGCSGSITASCTSGSWSPIVGSCNYTSTGTCNDRIQNQGENGVDCGGPCPACATSPCSGSSYNCSACASATGAYASSFDGCCINCLSSCDTSDPSFTWAIQGGCGGQCAPPGSPNFTQCGTNEACSILTGSSYNGPACYYSPSGNQYACKPQPAYCNCGDTICADREDFFHCASDCAVCQNAPANAVLCSSSYRDYHSSDPSYVTGNCPSGCSVGPCEYCCPAGKTYVFTGDWRTATCQ